MKSVGMRPIRLLVLLSLTALVPFPGATQTEKPWLGPAFSAAPTVLLDAAVKATADERVDVVVLLEEAHRTIEADGRNTHTWRMVYRILTARGVEGWSTTQVAWEPWYEGRPEIRARVITPEGAEHWLDPSTVGEFPLAQSQPHTFVDTRVLRGPLPAVAPGAVVEVQIMTRDMAPFFQAGRVGYFVFGASVPVLETRLVLDAPVSLPLRTVTRLLLGVEPAHSEADGRMRWTFVSGRLEPLATMSSLLPADVPRQRYVAFSTGRSWAAVAAAYAHEVDEQIAAANVEAVARDATRGVRTRDEKIARLLERLQRDVRYTAVEFGRAAIVPRTPAETLQRKYGDCKDQATLLIALLRAVGIDAHIALLNTGPGPDLEPELPGLGSFDHTIVYIPGSPPVWVDTTHEFVRPNQLPVPDQDRLALVATPGTRELVRTPAATPADNRIVETREFFLSDEGPAQVVETTEFWGAPELFYRSSYAQATQEQNRKGLKDYAADVYLAEDVTDIEFTDPHDLSRPFRLRFKATGVKRAGTELSEAGAAILLPPLTYRLPNELRDEEGESQQTPTAPALSAAAGIVLSEPYVTEWRYRIVPPVGFRPRPLPEGGEVRFGPAILVKEFRQTDDSVVTAMLRFDTSKGHFNAVEAEGLRRGIRELMKAEPIFVRFENVGETHLEAGRIREALAEFRRLASLHPSEAIHRTQIARALLAGGLGEAGRGEARRAIELQLTSVIGQRTLGWILQHDMIGRRFAKGFDIVGAIAAYRRALELNPGDRVARADLAILLEHNPEGIRYGAGARLDQAIAEYQALGEVEIDNPLFNNLPIALLWAGRYDELKQFLRSHRFPARLSYLYLAAVAASEGAPAALREASMLLTNIEGRRKALLEAGDMLKKLRLYPQAAELLAAGSQGAPNPAQALQQAELFRGVQRYEEIALPEDDPRSVVKHLMRDIFLGKSARDLLTLFVRDAGKTTTEESLQELEASGRQMRFLAFRGGISPEIMVDIALSLLRLGTEGDDALAYRIRPQSGLPTGPTSTVYFVVKEEGAYRLLGSTPSLGFLGREALRRAESGNLAGARQLLDWARDERPLGGGDDPFAGFAFPRFWTKGAEASPETTRYAAAALMAEMKDTALDAMPILLEGRERAASEADRQRFDLALTPAFFALERYEDLFALGQRLLASQPDSWRAFQVAGGALTLLGRIEEAEQLAQQRLQRLPDDDQALRVLADLAQRRHRFAEARRYHQRLIDLGKAQAGDYNSLAWQSLFEEAMTGEAVEVAQQAVRMSENQAADILHTLACLYAEVGRTHDALQVILHAMAVAGMEEPTPAFWYVFGRIAEQYGENEAAVAAYRKAEPQKEEPRELLPTSALARKRLSRLESQAGKDESRTRQR